MELTKKFVICKVEASDTTNAPFQLELRPPGSFPWKDAEKSLFSLNTETCERYNLPQSIELVGQTIVCSFETHELVIKESGPFVRKHDEENLDHDILIIYELKKSEVISMSHKAPPQQKHTHVSRTLQLSTLSRGGTLRAMPRPFYEIYVELTEEEYEACKQLSQETVMKMSFHLATVEEIEQE